MTLYQLKKLSWISILVMVFLLGATLLTDDAEVYAAEQAGQEQLNRKQEILQPCTENAKTNLKGDNSSILEQYLEPIHFKEKDNGIESVSFTKALDTELTYQNEANRYWVGFASHSGGEEASSFSTGFRLRGSGFGGQGEGEGGGKGQPDRLQRGPP